MHIARSLSGVPSRLPSERWRHISQNHPEMAGFLYDVVATVEAPDEVRAGNNEARIAMRKIRPAAADHSEMDDTDTVLRYQGDRLVGFTILNASQRR